MLSVSTAQRISLAYGARRVVELPGRLRQRALGLEHAVRAQAAAAAERAGDQVGVVEHLGHASASTGRPPRSNGVESTIVVRVRATPGTRLMRVRKSSRWVGRAGDDLEQEGLVAGDAVDLDDLRERLRGGGEGVVVEVGRAERAHERGQLVADPAGVELGGVAAHEAALLQPLDPVVDRRRLEPDQRPQLGIGRASVALQRLEQAQVGPIELRRMPRGQFGRSEPRSIRA